MMFDLLGGGLLGSIFGGLFRLAPEILKFMDKKNERSHELQMFTLQTDLEKMRGEFRMEERYVDHSISQLDAIKEAFKEQATTAKEAGWLASFITAITRPGITWVAFGMYIAVKVAGLTIAFQANANWADVITKSWDEDDFAMLNMMLTFWFVGRSIEKYQK
jgi:kynureninase